MFEVRDNLWHVYWVFAVKKMNYIPKNKITSGTEFLIYNDGWKWIDSYGLFPVSDEDIEE